MPETISSTSRNCSLPKNISLPTKKVGEPNAPRSTADWRVLDQLRLDLGSCARANSFARVEAGCGQRLRRHFGVVHLLRLDPHVMKRRLDIFLEHALELRGDRGAHQIERVDREERIPGVGLDLKALDEALGLQRVELALVLDAGERFGRRFVVGGLEDAAEQDRHIFELHAGALFDRRDRLVTEEGIGAAEIEHELRGGWAHGGLPDVCGFLYDPYHSNQPSRFTFAGSTGNGPGEPVVRTLSRKPAGVVAHVGGPSGDPCPRNGSASPANSARALPRNAACCRPSPP